jgi:hypothetical protein
MDSKERSIVGIQDGIVLGRKEKGGEEGVTADETVQMARVQFLGWVGSFLRHRNKEAIIPSF